jgi:uncharacterized membrane protein
LKLKPFLFSQQNVWLSKPIYNIEIHKVNTPHQNNKSSKTSNENDWFNILISYDFYDERDMA